MLIPVVAALIALVAALAGYTMVKFFGVIFLGQPREEKLAQAHDAGAWERVGMLWLVLGCVALGLLPVQFIQLIDPVTQQLVGAGLGDAVAAQRLAAGAQQRGAGQLRPGDLPARRRWRSFALAFLLVRWFYHGRAAPRAGLGLRLPVADRAHAGHGRRLRPADPPDLRAVLRDASANCRRPSTRSRATGSTVEDHFWGWLYLPHRRAGRRASRGWSACCSRAASRSTCCTASSR